MRGLDVSKKEDADILRKFGRNPDDFKIDP